MKKTILFLTGGKSDEHEISLISTKCVIEALDRNIFSPLIVGITKDGKWYLEDEKFWDGEPRADSIKLSRSKKPVTLSLSLDENSRGCLYVVGTREEYFFDGVFPILHGPFGEDGTIQGLLEIISIPYVGSGPGASWICMDKVLTKQLAFQAGINIADFVWFNGKNGFLENKKEIKKLGFPLFVKPARLGSSVGISKVNDENELESAVELALKYDSKCIVEKAIRGREIECGVLGLCLNARASVPGEIKPLKEIGWYSYEAKYLLKNGAEIIVPAKLAKNSIDKIQELALKTFNVLECDGMARVDLFLEEETDKLYLNEINTIPGFTPISMYPKMWEESGISYRTLISKLIELGFMRLL